MLKLTRKELSNRIIYTKCGKLIFNESGEAVIKGSNEDIENVANALDCSITAFSIDLTKYNTIKKLRKYAESIGLTIPSDISSKNDIIAFIVD